MKTAILRLMQILLLLIVVSVASCGPRFRQPPAEKSAGDAFKEVHSHPARVDRFWERAHEAVYRSPEELKAQHKREGRKGIVYDKLMYGDLSRKEVALTFDDGPHRLFTPQLIRLLKKYEVKATFFFVGKMAEKHKDLVRALTAEGHEVENHSFHHVNLTKIPKEEIEVEWLACNEVLKSITGREPKFCRPPGGDYDDEVIQAAARCGLTTVLWTDDPGDYARPGKEKIEDRVLANIDNGGIILLHDGVQQTINILPDIIEHLKKRGYKFITITEMAHELENK
ncbi:MAG: polysaccharide deacetylase family protein [Candidatus Eremiobacteraeota bacterium]|nr:polysaccharide deacetylase family protein [Candidatus Eremiobacteraeota bacterium]